MNQAGFTVIECVLALVIISMVAILANMTVKTVQQSERSQNDDELQWYFLVRELESDAHRFECVQLGNPLQLRSRITNKTFMLVCKQHELYLTKVHGGGYLPLMSNVQRYQTSQYTAMQVVLRVTMTNGQVRQARLRLPPTDGEMP